MPFLVSLAASSASAGLAALGEHRLQALLEERERPGRVLAYLAFRIERIRLSLLLVDAASKVLLGVAAVRLVQAAALAPWALAGLVAAGFFALLLGQTALRSLVGRDPARHLGWIAPVATGLDLVCWPLSSPLAALARAIRGRGPKVVHDATEELEYLIEKGSADGIIDEDQRELLESVIEFSHVRVREVMVPRPAIVALPIDASYDQVVRTVVESGFSRIPVFEDTIDQIVGILHAKRLLEELHRSNGAAREEFRLADLLAEPFFVPETMKISHLLTEFQRRGLQLAVAVDEFGGTAGLVTLEDVVEEIVGEIRDESDREERQPIRLLEDGVLQVEGGVFIRDLEDFVDENLEDWDLEFPEEGDYETVGGFVTSMIGHVPRPGQKVRHGDFVFTVRAADQRRVTRVEITFEPVETRGLHRSAGKEVESGAAPANARR